MSGAPLVTIPVGVIVERVKAASSWIDYTWRPTTVLAGQPDTPPWTALADDGERAAFYAGQQPQAPKVRKPLSLAEVTERCDRCHSRARWQAPP